MAIVEQENSERLEWRVWPACEKVGTAAIVIGLMAILSFVSMRSFENAWYAFLTLAGLTLALAEWLFPTRYRLDEQMVRVRGPFVHIERPWEAFRVAVELPDRVVLSPLSKVDGWIARRRSVTLMFCDNKEEVMAVIGRHVEVR